MLNDLMGYGCTGISLLVQDFLGPGLSKVKTVQGRLQQD